MTQDLETQARTAAQDGQYADAATSLIEIYGAEVLGFLARLTDDPELADDAFGLACEQLWRSMPRFEWRSSARTWFYGIARNCFFSALRDRDRGSGQRLSALPSNASALIDRTRTATPAMFRTDVKDAVAALRAELSPEEREILILRVDRQLDWRQIAEIVADNQDEAELERVSNRCRKQFQRIKDKLKRATEQQGLLVADRE